MVTGADSPAPGSPAPSLAVELRPERDAVSLGEPVFLELAIRNGIGERVHVDLGHNRRSNLALTIHRPEGRTEHPPRAGAEGMGLIGREVIEPGDEHRERLLLNEWFSPDRPGHYRVVVRITAPAVTDDGVRRELPPSSPTDVWVGEPDPDRLEAACRTLAEIVLHGRDARAGGEAARALATVADPVAVPFLAAVARKGGRGALEALAGLGRFGTREAVEALLEAAADRESGLRPHALRALRAVTDSPPDPGLRARIAEALREEGD